MTPELKAKLAKVCALAKNGTDGEKAAAQLALDRLVKKYDLECVDFDSLDKEYYSFTYCGSIEVRLMEAILDVMIDDIDVFLDCYRTVRPKKEIRIKMRYTDYVVVSCAYAYFRQHMRPQYRALVTKELKRFKKAKRQVTLEHIFLSLYLIKSGLVKPEDIIQANPETLSKKELSDRLKMLEHIEGGHYSTQVQTGNLLT